MSEEKKRPNEKVPTEEAIEIEIAELDDLDLAGVAGGSEGNVAEAVLATDCGCRGGSCSANGVCR
ncbi:hypothetical protein [Polyangium sp. y55x31]|uniref:hypothetical protein n=1 Tax=Polyangium sp. y55x31 TaxID=3042688 RepID=UPI002482B5F2|nr:hypothetical protein [Polyangium sp. y55x31]MDI1483410.1 hypothetical protein [Polyangium sp. y55x31]